MALSPACSLHVSYTGGQKCVMEDAQNAEFQLADYAQSVMPTSATLLGVAESVVNLAVAEVGGLGHEVDRDAAGKDKGQHNIALHIRITHSSVFSAVKSPLMLQVRGSVVRSDAGVRAGDRPYSL